MPHNTQYAPISAAIAPDAPSALPCSPQRQARLNNCPPKPPSKYRPRYRPLPNAPSTPELHWALAEGEPHALVAKLQAQVETGTPFPRAERVLTIDGVRVEYRDGFGLARASNTTPVIVIRFEADNDAALERIKSQFRAALQPLKPNAPLPY